MKQGRGFFLHVLNYSWVLFLIGISALAWLHAFGLEQKLKENTALAIELKSKTRTDKAENFIKWLESQEEIIPQSVQQIKADDIRNILQAELPDDSLQQTGLEAFPQIIIFKLKQESLTNERLNAFSAKIYKQDIVEHFSFQNELTTDLSSIANRIRIGFMALTLVFILVGVMISEYLAQVFVDSRSEIISNWFELGATNKKILDPYLKRTIFLGLASACLSVFLIGMIIFLCYYLMPWLYFWIETKKFFIVTIILLIFGPALQYFLVRRKIQLLLN